MGGFYGEVSKGMHQRMIDQGHTARATLEVHFLTHRLTNTSWSGRSLGGQKGAIYLLIFDFVFSGGRRVGQREVGMWTVVVVQVETLGGVCNEAGTGNEWGIEAMSEDRVVDGRGKISCKLPNYRGEMRHLQSFPGGTMIRSTAGTSEGSSSVVGSPMPTPTRLS